MKKMNQALKYGVALVTTTALPALAMAETSLLGTVKEEIGGLKAEVLALGVLIVGISVAFAVIRVGRRGTNAI